MDAIATAFASYLTLVSTAVSEQLVDVHGLDLKAVVVTHEGVKVPYAYQLWRIKPQSVCESYRENIGEYSRCTVAAKSLFNAVCQRMQLQRDSGLNSRKLKNMYCAASVSYRPTIASISAAAEQTPLEKAREACNLAIAEAYGASDPVVRKKKDKACDEYKALKAGSAP